MTSFAKLHLLLIAFSCAIGCTADEQVSGISGGRCKNVRDASQWRNPKLVVRRDGIGVKFSN